MAEEKKYTRESREWIPDEILESLKFDQIVEPSMTPEERARQILTQASPMAAKSVAFLAVYSANEQVRLRAAQYIIDGIVGGSFKTTGGEDDLLMALVAQLAENDSTAQDAMNRMHGQ